MNYYDYNENQSNRIDSSFIETISQKMVSSIMEQITDTPKTNNEKKE